MKLTKAWLAVIFLLVLRCGMAQSTGSIDGRITDQTGAVVPKAKVTVTNVGTGIMRTTVTTDGGDFTIPSLTPGTYTVRVEATGFARSEKAGETVVTGSTLTLNVELGLASTTQSVEVTATAPMVEETQSAVSGTLQSNEVQNLPILNRNFSGLVTLVPSARPTAAGAGPKTALGGGLGFGGGVGRNALGEIDGVTLRDDWAGGILYNLTLEGVQEFNVIAHDFPAQYDATAGGIVLITTKSGANQFHGTAFGFGRSQAFTALDYLSDPANGGTGKPPYAREEFGGSFGGPIRRDKLFFFGAIENLRLNQSLVWTGAQYSQAMTAKSALLSYTGCAICQTVGTAIVPSTYAPETLRDLQTTVRGDYQINQNHSIFARYLGEHLNAFDDLLTVHPDNDPNGSNNMDQMRGYNLVLSETWVIGSKAVNTLALAGTHWYDSQFCNCTLTGSTQIFRNMTFPDLQLGSPVPTVNNEEVVDYIQVRDTYSQQAGAHALKGGVEFINYPRLGSTRGLTGYVAFFDDPSVIISNKTTYPLGFLTPGAMKTVIEDTVNFGGPSADARLRGADKYQGFVQDDWKIKSNLTLNLGIRYAYNSNFFDQTQQSANRARNLLQAIGSPYGAATTTPTRDFSPRLGFVWNPDGHGRNVLRGSFGVYFDSPIGSIATSPDTLEQPTLQNVSSTYTNTKVGVGTGSKIVYGSELTPLSPGLTTFLPGGNTSLSWYAPGITDPYNQQAHIGYTRELTPTMVFSVDYVHVLGVHELNSQPINPVESSAWDPNAASYNTCGLTGSFRRLQCAFNSVTSAGTIGTVNTLGSTGRSQYNETTFHFEKRTKPLTFQASYVLAYAYAFGGAIGSVGTQNGPLVPEIPFQQFVPSEWGPSQSDERHRIVLDAVINMPFGIQAAPIFQYGSPRPYNCVSPTDWTGSGNGDTRCVQNSAGQLVAPPTTAGPLPAGETTVPVNFLRGTATYDLDSRFTKSFTIHERIKLNAFVELYNITNKANFGNNYGGTFGSSSFMQPLGYLNGGVSYPTSRQMQLGARLTF